MHNIQAQSVLISGASTGIGREVALTLARHHFTVFAGVRRKEDGEQLRHDSQDRLIPLQLDITDDRTIAAAVAQVAEQTEGRLTALVNNAGIAVPGPLELLPLAQLRRQFEVNTFGQIALTQACIPLLRRSTIPATIVNVSSASGRVALPIFGAYAASKFALEALSDSLRIELRPWGIRVVLIEPGSISTPIWEKTLNESATVWDTIDPEQRAPYEPLVAAIRATTKPGQGIPATRVATCIQRVLTARSPRARYLIGGDARLIVWIDQLPSAIRDWLVVSALKRMQPS